MLNINWKAIHLKIGWISSLCFCLCALPSAYEAYVQKYCSINLYTLLLWTVGEVCAIIYIAPKKDIPLLANYLINLIFLTIMWYYKI